MNICEQNRNIDYISFLQSFAVTLVVIGHCMLRFNGEIPPNWSTIIHDIIYSFHMPLFFVLAGFLLMNSFHRQSRTVQNIANFINNKFVRLIIPYFTIGSLAYMLKVFIFNKFAFKPASLDIMFYIKSMLIPSENPNRFLWFLPTLFLIFIFAYLVLNKDNYKRVHLVSWMILSFILSFLSHYMHIRWFNLDISRILYHLFYFFFGALFFDIKDKVLEILSNRGVLLFIILLFAEMQVIPLFQYNFVNYIFDYIVAILGILISISLAKCCCNYNHKFLWGICDGKFYQIYLLSWFFQSGIRILYQTGIVNYITVCFLMLIASFLFPILITNVIKSYFPKLKVFIGL